MVENFDQSVMVFSDYKSNAVKINLEKLGIYLKFQGEGEEIEWSQKTLEEENKDHYDLLCLKLTKSKQYFAEKLVQIKSQRL